MNTFLLTTWRLLRTFVIFLCLKLWEITVVPAVWLALGTRWLAVQVWTRTKGYRVFWALVPITALVQVFAALDSFPHITGWMAGIAWLQLALFGLRALSVLVDDDDPPSELEILRWYGFVLVFPFMALAWLVRRTPITLAFATLTTGILILTFSGAPQWLQRATLLHPSPVPPYSVTSITYPAVRWVTVTREPGANGSTYLETTTNEDSTEAHYHICQENPVGGDPLNNTLSRRVLAYGKMWSIDVSNAFWSRARFYGVSGRWCTQDWRILADLEISCLKDRLNKESLTVWPLLDAQQNSWIQRQPWVKGNSLETSAPGLIGVVYPVYSIAFPMTVLVLFLLWVTYLIAWRATREKKAKISGDWQAIQPIYRTIAGWLVSNWHMAEAIESRRTAVPRSLWQTSTGENTKPTKGARSRLEGADSMSGPWKPLSGWIPLEKPKAKKRAKRV